MEINTIIEINKIHMTSYLFHQMALIQNDKYGIKSEYTTGIEKHEQK